MKLTTTLLYASLLVGTANAFVERSSVRARNTALAGGFLDGKSRKSAQYFCNLRCLGVSYGHLSSFHVSLDIYIFVATTCTGSQKKSDIMQREDDAMWVEDPEDKPSGGGGFWNPFAIAKGLDDPDQVTTRKAKSKTPPPPPPEPKKSGGFKFPWDK